MTTIVPRPDRAADRPNPTPDEVADRIDALCQQIADQAAALRNGHQPETSPR